MRSNIIKLHRITLVNISALWNFLLLKWNWYDVEYWTILQACCWLVISNMTSAVIQILDVDLLLIFCRFKCDLRCYPMWYVGLLRLIVSNLTSDIIKIRDVGMLSIGRFKNDTTCYPNTGCTCKHVADWLFQMCPQILPNMGCYYIKQYPTNHPVLIR